MKILLGVLAVILAVLAGGHYMNAHKAAEDARAAAAAAKAQEQQAARDALNAKFEEALNGFLKEVSRKAADYKARRDLVTDLTKPENLKDAAYIAANYDLMKDSIPQLHALMDEVMSSFQIAEQAISDLLRDWPESEREAALLSWKNLKDRQAGAYMAFFAAEQDILNAHLELMKFYNERSGALAFDAAAGAIIFRDPADKAREMELRLAIDEMSAQQAHIIGGTGE